MTDTASARVPRRDNGEGASAPQPPLWRVDAGRNFPLREFLTQEEAEAYALTCPPRTHVIYPPGAKPTARIHSSTDAPAGRSVDAPSDPATAPVTHTAASICQTAAALVGGARQHTHGDKDLNFTLIADLWNGYWRMKCRVNGERVTTPFTALDIGNMMELLKVARRMTGAHNIDNYVDAAGYAACTGEIAASLEQDTPRT